MASVTPVVSVIVSCYGVTQFVVEALESLRAQTFRQFEVIVVNDGCPDTDNLERVLAPYLAEIVYLKEENRGIAGARNAAIGIARGSLIAVLDGDDAWCPNYLEFQVGYLAAHPDVDIVYPNAVFTGETDWKGRLVADMFPSRGAVTCLSLLSGECSVFCSVTGRIEAFRRVGLYDAELRTAEDLDLWLRATKAGIRIDYHREVLVQYRLRRGSLTNDKIHLAAGSILVYSRFLNRPDITDAERNIAISRMRDFKADLGYLKGRLAAYRGQRSEAISNLMSANEIRKNWRIAIALVMLRTVPSLLYKVLRWRFRDEYTLLH